ncbi:M10 family metallopeptidase C-terminal domain-containing protein [Microvirga sp. GCM10011540]|uniref:M10 family metallopeptidase C-terminal domain-containing protein n=1 Tax=Microvirga sp. GCM10011540 TaxID=3317338 RepID=UPI0036089983
MPAVTTYRLTSDAYINGILGDLKWAVNSFTYSFPTSGSYYGTSYGTGENISNFGGLNTAQQATVRSTLKTFASVANLSFAETAESSFRHADLRFAMSDKPRTAWAYFPSTNAAGGDAWFNKSSGAYNSPAKGNYAYMTFMHEIGHALGLEHAHEEFVMPQERDSMEYTVMSYRSYVGASTTSGYVNEGWGYAQSLMMYDIAALQHMYGANYSTNSGNTTYSWSPTTGEMSVNGTGQGAPGGNRIFQTVWDGGGTDTYDFSQYSGALKVDLQPGGWTTTSTTQLAKLHYNGSKIAAGNIANALLYKGDGRSLIENAIGGSGNDTLIGNQAANVLKGAAGNDTLMGGGGDDALDGGIGSDTAVYSGMRAHYSVTLLPDGSLQVADLRSGTPDGKDVVWNVEWFQFTDKLYALSDLAASEQTTTTMTATSQDLVLTGTSDADTLNGGAGNDQLYGYAGNDTLYGRDGDDVLIGGAGGDYLDGGASIDTVSYETAKAGVVADLMSSSRNTGDAKGDKYVSIENLTGSAFADTLRGNDAANVLNGGAGTDRLYGRGGNDALDGDSGNDYLDGGADNDILHGGDGSDTVYGGAGADELFGGAGADVFVFKSVGESLPSARDTIRDFVSGVDKIDLRSIDASTKQSYNQAFTFVGSGTFSGKAGELQFIDGVLSGDINGDKLADFQINVPEVLSLAASDFYL